MGVQRVQRRLAAILAADVVGYSRLMEADETGTLDRLKALRRELFEPVMKRYRGRTFKTTGDGALVEFKSAVDAVSSAVDIQHALAKRDEDLAEDRRIWLRIGVSLGDVIVEGSDLYGNGVNVAARLEGLAEPGGICISGNVHEQVRSASGLVFDDLGEQIVKNIERPVRAFRVSGGSRPSRAASAGSLSRRNEPSIAVLPFANISGDPEQEYFADGLSEDLITDLSKISDLFVVARNSSFAFKGQNVDVRDVAGKLGVRHVLEGSVRKIGSKVRINAQLVDAATGGHLWAERYDGDLGDIFTLQDEIMAEIVTAMELRLTSAEQASTERKPTNSVEAYDLCLRGRAEYYRYTPDCFANATRYFEQAIEIDPSYADAYGYLSYSLTTAYVFTWSEAEDSLDRGLKLAEKSLALDDRSSVAHTRLGWLLGFLSEYERATERFEQAISLDPRNADAYFAYGETMNRAGWPDKAVPLIERALGMDVIAPPGWEFGIGHAYLLMRRFDEALTAFLRVLDRVPQFIPARVQLARTYGELRRISDAKAVIKELQEVAPRYTIRSAHRMWPYCDEENRERLRDGLRKAGLPE